jgi:hypothetical protein
VHGARPGVAIADSLVTEIGCGHHHEVHRGRAHTPGKVSETTSRRGEVVTQRGWSSPWTAAAQ